MTTNAADWPPDEFAQKLAFRSQHSGILGYVTEVLAECKNALNNLETWINANFQNYFYRRDLAICALYTNISACPVS